MLENRRKHRLEATKIALLALFIFAIFSIPVFSANSDTINFQGKIVRNNTGSEGLNVVAGTPSCVVAGNSNDSCDFRVKYYSASSGGTLLGTEVFSNVEIGYFNGVFNLVLGSGSYSAGSESSFRNIFLNNSNVFLETDFAPDGTNYTETFLGTGGLRIGARAAAYAISASGSASQFQFDVVNDATGYSNVSKGQVFFDGDDNILRVYDGTNWLAIQAYLGNIPSLWTLNETPTPDVISSYTGLDVAMGGSDSTAPFFFDVSAQLLTLTNTTSGLSFKVNDENSDTTPFVVDASGNVGIGTSTPGYKLEVVGGRTVLKATSEEYTLGISRTDGSAGTFWLGVNASTTPSLYIKNTGGSDRLIVADGGMLSSIHTNSTESGLIIKRPTTDTTHIQWQMLSQSNNLDFWISGNNGSTTKNFVKFDWTNGITNFDAGNVGIGVASPNAILDIKAATTSLAQLNLTSSAGVNPSSPVSGDLWWNGTNLYFFDGSSNKNLLTGILFTDGGDVTYLTSLTDDFALGGSGSTAPFFFDEGAELLALTNTTAGLSFRVNDQAGDTTPFVIDASGNVGIGTSIPGAKLDIAGVSSTISNTAGDISLDSASGNISFSGDSLTNVLNATFAGTVTLNGSQLRLGNYVANPSGVGEGAMVYNSSDKKLYYYKDTGWAEVGNIVGGTTNQTIRYNGSSWVGTSALTNDGTNVSATGQVRVGNFASKPTGVGAGALVYDTTLGSLFVYDGADWQAVSTSSFQSANGSVSNNSYLQLTHNLNTSDIITSAWVKAGSQWKTVNEQWSTISHSVQEDFDNSIASVRTTVAANAVNLNSSQYYGVYNSNVEPIPSANSIGRISWEKSTTANTQIGMQTRTGDTPDPSGLTWFKLNNSNTTASDSYCSQGRICLGTAGKGDVSEAVVGSVMLDGSTYKMWYTGGDSSNTRIFYATSVDGLNWQKYDNTIPSASDTSSTNGRVPLGTNTKGDDVLVGYPSVILDGSTYKMWYSGYDGSYWRIYYATSSDGLAWTKYNNVAAGNSDTTSTDGRIPIATTAGRADTNHVFAAKVIKDGSTYKMWYTGADGSGVYRVLYATSSDGLAWTKYDNTILSPSDTTGTNGRIPLGNSSKADTVSVGYPMVLLDGGVYKMWYAGINSGGTYFKSILYATSSDGLTWTKYNNAIQTTSNVYGIEGGLTYGSDADVIIAYPSVIKDIDSNSRTIYRMYYNGRLDAGTYRGFYAYNYPDNTSWSSWATDSILTTPSITLDNADTHTNWTGTNATIADGDITRKVNSYEDEFETTVGNITKITSSTNGGYADATISSTNVSTYGYVTFWIRGSQTGQVLKIGMGEGSSTQHEYPITIDTANVWQKVYWDISGIPTDLRNGITKLRLTNQIASSNTIYLDNIVGIKLSNQNEGYTIPSAANDYIQYRAIMTTQNTTYAASLLKVELIWSQGYKVEIYDANTVRVYNYSGSTQDLRLSVTNGGGNTALGNGWTESGGNIYRATGNVGIGDATPDTTLKVVGSLCVKSDGNNCAGSTAGTIYANNTSLQNADLAEMYKVSDSTIDAGDVVSISTNISEEIEKSNQNNSANLMGVISTAPGLVFNDSQKDGYKPVALIGRVPIKVIIGSTSIKEGDVIGVSPLKGFGAKQNGAGMTVAKSLENTVLWNDQSCGTVNSLKDIKWPKDKGNNELKPCYKISIDNFDRETRESLMDMFTIPSDGYIYVGKIMGYVSVAWHQPTWFTEGMQELLGSFGEGEYSTWSLDGDRAITTKDVLASSFSSNYGSFNVLSGGILNIGSGNFSVDTGGNTFISGDMLIRGDIKGDNGNISLILGDTNGDKAFEIKNSDGKVVFSVDSRGEVGGSGIYKTGWLKVEGNSNIDVNHGFGRVPSNTTMIVSKSSDGVGFSTKGVGSNYYFESTDNNTLRIFNSTSEPVFVKITIGR